MGAITHGGHTYHRVPHVMGTRLADGKTFATYLRSDYAARLAERLAREKQEPTPCPSRP
jgi:hypothetical protein